MAKPVITGIIWASDAVYTTGPAPLIGTANKITPAAADIDEGWNANEIPPAQHNNLILNNVSQWTNWLASATNAPTLDDHVLQTDVSGTAGAAAILLGSTASAEYPIDIQGFNSGTAARAINIEVGNGSAVNASNNSGTATCRYENFGSGLSGQFVNSSGSGGAIQAIGSDYAVEAAALLTGGDAVIKAYRYGAGATIRGLVNLQPSNIAPTTPILGDMWFHSGNTPDTGHGAPAWYDGNTEIRAWGTENGFTRIKDETLVAADESAAILVGAGTNVYIGAGDDAVGDYDVVFSGTMSAQAGAFPQVGEVVFKVGGVVVSTQRLDFLSLGSNSSVAFFLERTVNFPGGASVQCGIEFRSLAAGKTIRMEQSRIRAIGAF